MNPELRIQLLPIYEQIGAVVQNSQHLEFAIGFSITLMKQLNSDAFTDEEFIESMDYFSEKTFGRLIGEFKKNFILDEKCAVILKNALDERNYIVHSVFNEMAEDLRTPEGREKILNRVVKARTIMKDGHIILDDAVQTMLKASGLNHEEIVENVKKSIEI